jgi:drug/metabolite transporter (DMT)-like permease
MYRAQLRWQPIAILLLCALTWGANWAIVKITFRELEPLFMAGLRSLVASVCLYIWMWAKGITVFPSRRILLHGIMVGFLFGLEFALLYAGIQYTLASRLYVLLYTAPFFVALGAHFFLKGDRLNPWKAGGLVLAFAGVVALFSRDLGSLSFSALPMQTLFYQVSFSAPPLLIISFLLENPTFSKLSLFGGFSLFYQCIIVAFLSYLVWFYLIHRYPVSLLHAFSFFTPVFGVLLSGALILGEIIGANLIVALILVSLGMVLVNRQPKGETDSEGKSSGNQPTQWRPTRRILKGPGKG